MTIQELTDRMNAFVGDMGWYDPDSPFEQSPRNIAISLALEAGEVLEHFQWSEDADPSALAGELADVALYLLQLAYLTGIDLEQAILDKLAVNYTRQWPGRTRQEAGGRRQEARGGRQEQKTIRDPR